MNVDEALARYVSERHHFRDAANAIKEQLELVAGDIGITVVVHAREKDPASYRAKVADRGYSDAWAEMTDKAGARVIVSGPSEVDSFVSAVQKSERLRVVGQPEDKRDVINPESLSYSGVHLQVIAPAVAESQEPIECEVQVRTAAQDAWSVVSHKLLYKPVLELPKEDQHAVYRLVALMELFDQEVERVSAKLPTLPGYEFRHVLQAAESEFLALAHAQSYRSLSVEVLGALGEAVPRDVNYPTQLRSWVTANRGLLSDAIQTYGPHSDLQSSYRYTLFSQAELLIILERLTACPEAFTSAWQEAGLPIDWLRAVATYSDADVS